jgi:hypothetical protein
LICKSFFFAVDLFHSLTLCPYVSERNRSKLSKSPSEQLKHSLFISLSMGWNSIGLCLCYLTLAGIDFADVPFECTFVISISTT